MTDRELAIHRATDGLRRDVRDGLKALRSGDNRWTNERIAEELGVDPRTVQRWGNLDNTIRRSHAEQLIARWPTEFPNIIALLGDLERTKQVDRSRPRIDLGESPVQTYRDVIKVLESDPGHRDLQAIRHCAFHGDLGDERRDEGAVPADLQPLLERFNAIMTARIVDGWDVRTIFTVGTQARLDDRVTKVSCIDAPSFEVRAFVAGSVPLVSPLIVGDVAFLATDHQRWNRAEAAIRIEGNTSVLLWLRRYFDMLWDRAPYRLRTMAGPNQLEMDRLRRHLRAMLASQADDAS